MSPSVRRPRIAIVVDDDLLLNALAFTLEADGWEALPFRQPAELLEQSPRLHCLLVDRELPGMDGLALILRLRERGVTAPAVIIVNKTDAAFSERAAQAGVAIVDQPLIGDEFKRRIRAALRGRD
jgi:FixJ family two-component response regulator